MASPNSQSWLRQWMENKLNGGDYPGLTWLDKPNGVFKLPWYKTKDVSDERKPIVFKPFVDWGYYSNRGTYRGGDNPNFSHFKHNMRCALNKKNSGFQKLFDHSKFTDDPHLIYKFQPTKSSAYQDLSLDNVIKNKDRCQQENIPVHVYYFDDQFQSDLVERSNYSQNFHCGSVLFQQPSLMNQYDDTHFQKPPAFSAEFPLASFSSNTFPQEMNNEACLSANLPSDLEAIDFDALIDSQDLEDLPMSGISSLDTQEISPDVGAQGQSPINIGCQNMAFGATDKHRMNVKVSYGQPPVTIIDKTVGENGCRLHSNIRLLANTPFEKDVYGPEYVTDIMLPAVDQNVAYHNNAKQVNFINNILNKMERGFTLTFKDGDIYAQRFSASRVYFCDEHFRGTRLDRKLPVKVFDFKNFKSKLSDFYSSNSSETQTRLPAAHFYLTIGVEVDPTLKDHGPLSQVLMSVCVTHLAANELYNEAYALKRGQGDSMEPLHSDFNSMDRVVEMHKEPPMMMQATSLQMHWP